MSFINKLKKIIYNPGILIRFLGIRGFFNWMSDDMYLKLNFKLSQGNKLSLKNPKTYNEKLQWLKINDRNPLYTKLVDKYLVRDYIKDKIGEEYLIPLIKVYNCPQEINWNKLPNKFVLKGTHGSGCNVICDNKEKLNKKGVINKFNKWLKYNWYWYAREWPYKNCKPRIICEKHMLDESEKDLKDYKIFCFNGEPKLIQVDIDRFGNHKQNFYDKNWNFKDVKIWCENDPDNQIEKPKNYDDMIRISKILSKPFPHVRVDLYNVDGKIYFGELTFSHNSGLANFIDKDLEIKMGNWLDLSQINHDGEYNYEQK